MRVSRKRSNSAVLNRIWTSVRPWLPLLGFGLLAYILSGLNYQTLGHALMEAQPLLLSAAAGLFLVNVLSKSLRWYRLLRHVGASPGFRDATIAFAEGIFYGSITIGRLGELKRIEYLTRLGFGAAGAVAMALADRVLDLAFLALVGTGVLAAFGFEALAWGLAGGGILGLGVLALLQHGVRKRSRSLNDLVTVFANTTWRNRLELFGWTVLGWLASFASIWSIAKAVGAILPFSAAAGAGTLGAIASLLPITFQGLGTREAAFVLVFDAYSIDEELAVLSALLVFANGLFCGIAFGLLGFLRYQDAPEG